MCLLAGIMIVGYGNGKSSESASSSSKKVAKIVKKTPPWNRKIVRTVTLVMTNPLTAMTTSTRMIRYQGGYYNEES